jgi:hypothetical protein
VDVEIIRQRVRDDRYLIKSHAVVHALKEGFDREHMVEAVLSGTIIEDYTAGKRALICGKTSLSPNVDIYTSSANTRIPFTLSL